MANQLRWDPVEVPRLDTRGLAIAGDTINNSMDRFAALLAQRDARLNKQATDGAAAQVLAANDPAAVQALLAQAASGQLGDRVDTRAIAALGNQRTGQITDQALANSNLAMNESKQAKLLDMQKFQPLYSGIDAALRDGKVDEARRLQSELQAQGGGLNLYDVLQTGGENLTEYQHYQDTLAQRDRENRFKERELGLRAQQVGAVTKDRQVEQGAYTLAQQLSKEAGAESTASAKGRYLTDPRVQALGPKGAALFADNFTTIHDAALTPTDAIVEKTAGTAKGLARQEAALAAKASQVQGDLDSPVGQAAQISAKNGATKPAQASEVQEAIDDNSSNIFDWQDRDLIARTQGSVTPKGNRVTLDDMKESARLTPSQSGFLNRTGSLLGGAWELVKPAAYRLEDAQRAVAEKEVERRAAGNPDLANVLQQERQERGDYGSVFMNTAQRIADERVQRAGRTSEQLAQDALAKDRAALKRNQELLLKQQRLAKVGESLPAAEQDELLKYAAGDTSPSGSTGHRASPGDAGILTPAGDFLPAPGLSKPELEQLQKLMAKDLPTPSEQARIDALWAKSKK
jgi:hypothetical protein